MNAQGRMLKLISEEFARSRARNPAYSLRAFARRLGMPPSALSGILAGKLRVTRRTGERVMRALCIDPRTGEELLLGLDNRSKVPTRPDPYTLIELDQFQVISDWYHFAVLSLADTPDWSDDAEKVAARLGIPVRDARNAIKRLESIGLLKTDDKGTLRPTGVIFRTTTDIQSAFIRQNHLQGIDLARRSMEEDEFSTCDFGASTIAIDPSRIPEAKILIRDFRRKLSALLEQGERKQVYRFSTQLYALSDRRTAHDS